MVDQLEESETFIGMLRRGVHRYAKERHSSVC